MSDRERYWKKVQDLKAKLAAFRGTPTPVQPKRSSGPTIVPSNWHEAAQQASIPARCFQCGEPQLGDAKLHGEPGRCGRCQSHNIGGTMPPLTAAPDGPQAA